MSELKPCPFCGGKAVLKITPNKAMCYIRCKNEDIEQFLLHKTKVEAIAAWNTRPSSWVWVEDGCEMPKKKCWIILTDVDIDNATAFFFNPDSKMSRHEVHCWDYYRCFDIPPLPEVKTNE